MQELPVSSRMIKSVYFSQEDGQLRICFRNGEERLFTDVPKDAALEMVNSTSPGQYYINRIRQSFRRVA